MVAYGFSYTQHGRRCVLIEVAATTHDEVHILLRIYQRAIHLYRGTVFETACDDHWLVGIATEYKLKYIGLVNELLALLAKYDDYNGINTFATQALKLTPENIKAYYWLIYAMYHSGAIELAKNEAQRAKSILTSEEYTTLKKYLLQDETLAYSQLSAA